MDASTLISKLQTPNCQLICGSCVADPLNFYCNDCIKLKRPSYGRQSSENSCPLADSNGEAEAADSHDDADEDDDEYLMREDSDERAHNKAVPLGNTPARGEGSAQPFML